MTELTVTQGAASEPAARAELYGRHMATGSLLSGLMRLGVIPLGLLAAVFLARALGPGDLGVFAVASSIVWWTQQMLNAFFNRTAIKLIAETAEWQPIATALIQLNFLASIAAGVLLFVTAPLLAAGFNAPALKDALYLFAFALPIFSLAQAHENTMIGRRAFKRSAFFPLFFNSSRSLFILLFVGIGWGLNGAILAQLTAGLVELAYARISCRPKLLARVSFPVRRIARYSAPMFLDGVGRQLNPRVDLWSVQAFAGSIASGYYSAAQSALSPLGSIHIIFSPILLATMAHALEQGHADAARSIARNVLRLAFCLLPLIALYAGASSQLVALVFGNEYLPAAPLLTWLSLGVFASIVLSFTTVLLAALDQPGVIAFFTLPMLLASTAGSLLLVPQIGAIGAATTTMLTQWGAMLASLWLLQRRTKVVPDAATILRVIPLAVLAFAAANLVQLPGLWVILWLAGWSVIVLLLLFGVRLVTLDDLRFLLSLVRRPRIARED